MTKHALWIVVLALLGGIALLLSPARGRRKDRRGDRWRRIKPPPPPPSPHGPRGE